MKSSIAHQLSFNSGHSRPLSGVGYAVVMVTLTTLFVGLSAASADDSRSAPGQNGDQRISDGNSEGAPPSSPPAFPPSRKGFDPRLPPVIPGEVIVTETGDRVKVWSSSGPVPVGNVPGAPGVPGVPGASGVGPAQPGYGNNGIGVIVDGRGRVPDFLATPPLGNFPANNLPPNLPGQR